MDSSRATPATDRAALGPCDPERALTELEDEPRRQQPGLVEKQGPATAPLSPDALAALDAVDSLVAITDYDGRTLLLNRACQEFLGLPADQVQGKWLWDLFAVGNKESLSKRIFEQLRRGQSRHELQRISPAGQQEARYMECSSRLIDRGPSLPPYVLLTGIDVTERRRAEQALRDSEERMRAVIQNMPVMMVAIGTLPDFDQPKINYDVLVWNQECQRVTGYTAAELFENFDTPTALLPDGDYRRKFEEDWRRLRTNIWNQVWQIRAKDGSIKTTVWCNMAERFPIPGWAAWGLGIDITEQVEARAALERAQEELEARVAQRTAELVAANKRLRREVAVREETEQALFHQTRVLRAILDSIADGVVVADQAGKLLLFNPAAERILQAGPVDAPPEEWPRVYGLYLPDRRTHYPPDQLALVRAIQGKRAHETLVYLNREGGPRDVWISVSACPVTDETGQMRGGVAVFRDITESIRSHEELRREQRLLQDLLRAHERDRQLLAYEIHDGMAQDVAGALMHLEAHQSKAKSDPASAQRDFEISLKLLRNTLDEARRVITGLRPPILDEQGIVAAIEYLINEHRLPNVVSIRFRHKVSARRFDPLLDGTIYRIVQEALSNVRKHSGADQAEVSLVQVGERLQLEIADNGVGFDPTQVAENRYGLEGIRERVRLLGGTVRVQSTLRKGTRIVIELPTAYAQPSQATRFQA